MIALVVLGAWTWFLIRIAPLSIAGCTDLCDYRTLSVVVNSYLVIDPIIVIFAGALTIPLWRRGWWAAVPSALGIVAILTAFWVASELANKAMLLD